MPHTLYIHSSLLSLFFLANRFMPPLFSKKKAGAERRSKGQNINKKHKNDAGCVSCWSFKHSVTEFTVAALKATHMQNVKTVALVRFLEVWSAKRLPVLKKKKHKSLTSHGSRSIGLSTVGSPWERYHHKAGPPVPDTWIPAAVACSTVTCLHWRNVDYCFIV